MTMLKDIEVVSAIKSPPLSFHCPKSMKLDCQRVFQGEYDIAYEHPDPVILDVGANVGAFTLWAIWRWPNSFVHCYEPLPINLESLRKNLASRFDVALHPFAIGNPIHTKLRLGKHSCGETSFFDTGDQLEDYVEVITKWPSVMPLAQILKLDVEGAEVEILENLVLDFDAIVLEYHSEERRRKIDNLLFDYILVGSNIYCPDRGVVKYLHKRILE